MKRLIPLAALIVSPAFASADTDYPHRDWGKVATLDMTASDATTCVTHELARQFERIIPVPTDGGAEIDGGPGGGFFGVAHDPWVRYKIRTEGGAVLLRISYRHPISQGTIERDVRRMSERCLKVRRIETVQAVAGSNE